MWPEGDENLGLFMQRLSVTHVKRWQKHRNVVGEGHLYQARFKSFPVGRLNGPVPVVFGRSVRHVFHQRGIHGGGIDRFASCSYQSSTKDLPQ